MSQVSSYSGAKRPLVQPVAAAAATPGPSTAAAPPPDPTPPVTQQRQQEWQPSVKIQRLRQVAATQQMAPVVRGQTIR